MKPDPLGMPRHPLAVYLLVLATFSGLSQAVGVIVAATPDIALPPAVNFAWAVMLFLGGLSSLAGMFWQGSVPTGLTLKRAGMAMLGGSGLIYAIVLVWTFGQGGLLSGGIILGFSLACWMHYRTVVRRIRAIITASP